MGCYDTVNVPCPKCGERVGFQSKSGECLLEEYPLESCPDDVLANVNRHSPHECPKCGTSFAVELTMTVKSVEVPKMPNDQAHPTAAKTTVDGTETL